MPSIPTQKEMTMHLIEAFIRPERLPEVTRALREQHFDTYYVDEVSGSGVGPRRTTYYRGAPCEPSLLHFTRVELCVSDDLLATAVACLRRAARTGQANDGKIFVHAVDAVIDIQESEPPPTAEPQKPKRSPLLDTIDAAFLGRW